MQAVVIVDCRQNRSCPRRRWPETLLTELEQQLSGLFDAALGSALGSALGEAPDFTFFENGLVRQRIAHAPNPRHQLVSDIGWVSKSEQRIRHDSQPIGLRGFGLLDEPPVHGSKQSWKSRTCCRTERRHWQRAERPLQERGG